MNCENNKTGLLENLFISCVFVLYSLTIFYPFIEVNFSFLSWLYDLTTYDFRRLTQVIFLVITPLFLLYAATLKTQFFETVRQLPIFIQICLSIFAFSIIIGALISIAPLQSLMVCAQQLLSIFIIFVIAGLCKHRVNVRKFLVVGFIIVVLLYVCLSMYGYVTTGLDKKYIYYYYSGFRQNILLYFSNIRYLTQWLTWILPLVGFLLFLDINKIFKTIIYIALIYLWMLALSVQSRAFMLEWLLIFVLLGIIYRRHAIKYLACQLTACIVGAILCGYLHLSPVVTKDIRSGALLFICLYAVIFVYNIFISSQISQRFYCPKKYKISLYAILLVIFGLIVFYVCYMYQYRIYTIFNDNGRIEIWRASLEIFYQGNWFGVGSGILPLYGIKLLQTGQVVIVAQPHNFLIRLVAENGLIGFVTLIMPILYGVYFMAKKCWKEATSNNYSPLKMALLASLVAAIVHSQVSGLMETPLSQLTAVIIIGIMLYEFSTKKMISSSVKSYSVMPENIIMTVMILLSFYLCISTYFSIENITNIQKQRVCRDVQNPYYWMDGFLALDYPGQYFCSRNYQELKYWSTYGPYQVRFESN